MAIIAKNAPKSHEKADKNEMGREVTAITLFQKAFCKIIPEENALNVLDIYNSQTSSLELSFPKQRPAPTNPAHTIQPTQKPAVK